MKYRLRERFWVWCLRFAERFPLLVEGGKFTLTSAVLAASMVAATFGMILLGAVLLPPGFKVFTWTLLGLGVLGTIYVAVLLARRFGYNPES